MVWKCVFFAFLSTKGCFPNDFENFKFFVIPIPFCCTVSEHRKVKKEKTQSVAISSNLLISTVDKVKCKQNEKETYTKKLINGNDEKCRCFLLEI